jgi:hypothetical protein
MINNSITFQWFWDLTDNEIHEFMYQRNHQYYTDSYSTAWRYGFLHLTTWLEESNGDRLLMRIKYADELASLADEISNRRSPGVPAIMVD